MSDRQILGDSLVLALSDLGNCDDCTYMETGVFELFGETEEGLECSSEVDIADMCAEAADLIEQLKKENESAFKKGFWAGFEDARCFPDESNVLQRYTLLTKDKE